MELFMTLAACIIIFFVATYLAKRLKVSVVIGSIITGILLGSDLLRDFLIEPNAGFVLELGNVSIIAILFVAGLEVSWSMLYREKKDALFVASFASITSFLLGFAAFTLMGFPLFTSLTLGICISITAEATKARLLIELKKLKTKLGSLMMGAGIIDDVIGICLFMTVCYFFTGSLITEETGVLLGAILGFFSGIIIHRFIGRESYMIQKAERLISVFIFPFFFISMGLHFSLESLIMNPMLSLAIIALAITGKISGVMLTRHLTGFELRKLYLVGWAMNSRGGVELAIAFTAFKVGLLDPTLYSGILLMALVTTFIFPFFVTGMIRKNPGIMD